MKPNTQPTFLNKIAELTGCIGDIFINILSDVRSSGSDFLSAIFDKRNKGVYQVPGRKGRRKWDNVKEDTILIL